MLTTVPASPETSRPRPGTRAPARPDSARPLRVVTREELREARRRVRARRLVIAAVAFVAISLFGVVIAHVLLMQGQFQLEAMQREAAAQQAEYDRLRLQVAELESPGRIVATAQERLGMVAPPKITYLAPSADALPTPADRAPAAAPGQRPADAAAPPSSWSTVKPHLSEG
jgi:cell division protein FtsL